MDTEAFVISTDVILLISDRPDNVFNVFSHGAIGVVMPNDFGTFYSALNDVNDVAFHTFSLFQALTVHVWD
jgi:hypothetical protein